MDIVTIHAAKTNLSQLLARVEAGEEIILARGKTPIAKIVPLQALAIKRQFGALSGMIGIGPEFLDPLPPEEQELWGA